MADELWLGHIPAVEETDLGQYQAGIVKAGTIAIVRHEGSTELSLEKKHQELRKAREEVLGVVSKLPPVLDKCSFAVLMDCTVIPLEDWFACQTETFPSESLFMQADIRLHRLLNVIDARCKAIDDQLRNLRKEWLDARTLLFTELDSELYDGLPQAMYYLSYALNAAVTDAAKALDYIHKAKNFEVRPPAAVFREWRKPAAKGAAQVLAEAGRGSFFQLEVMAEQILHNTHTAPVVKRNLDLFRDVLCLPSASGGRETRLRVEKLVHSLKARIEQERAHDLLPPLLPHGKECHVFDMLLSCINNAVEDVDAEQVAVNTEAAGGAHKTRITLHFIAQLGHFCSMGNRLALHWLWEVLKNNKDWVMRETALLELKRLATFERYCTERLPPRDVEATVARIAEVYTGHGESGEVKRTACKVLGDIIASAPRTAEGDKFAKKLEGTLQTHFPGERVWPALFADAQKRRLAPRAARRAGRHGAQHHVFQPSCRSGAPATLHDPAFKQAALRMHPESHRSASDDEPARAGPGSPRLGGVLSYLV